LPWFSGKYGGFINQIMQISYELEDERKSGQTNPSMKCISDGLIIKQLSDSSDDEVRQPSVLP
jgi:hypothetical protein